MSQVICEHPRVIINPKLPELLAKNKWYSINNETPVYFHYSRRNYYDFPWKQFAPKRLGITSENAENSYVLNKDTGETIPLYLVVRCGHCTLCNESKRNAYVSRMELESLTYDCEPWFCTFTYRDDDSEFDNNVHKRHAQLFLKRLRINLERYGYTRPIRYCLCGEYGTHTKRAHYHAIIWNIKTDGQHKYNEIRDIMEKSWSHGFIQTRKIDMKNNNTFYYTTKYMTKSNVKPEGKETAPFFLSSKGHGGIGSPWIKQHVNEIRKQMNPKYEYYNKWTDKVKELPWTKYLLDKCFPSFCRSVSSKIRKSCSRLALNIVYATKFFDPWVEWTKVNFNDLFNHYGKYIYMPKLLYTDVPDYLRRNGNITTYDVHKEIYEDLEVLEDEKNLSVDLAFWQDLSIKRDIFLGKLFEFVEPIDLYLKASKLRSRLAVSVAREQF